MRSIVYMFLLSLAFASVGLAAQPNILWITSEDNGPHLGCYGDTYADSPHLDGLAARGMRYVNAWSNAPVCAPARTAIITGVYPPSTGAQHMRTMTALPRHMKMFPQLLREAGYYCTNNHKEDYNVEKPGQVWDDSSRKAHWRRRKEGQPFFAVFNFTVTHESQIRRRPHTPVHDPAEVRIPAYHPDTPEVRRDWAQYYDKITEMDAQAGRVLRQLEEDQLTDETIVFYYADHGPGLPRGKRSACNSGLNVPMIVSIPEKFRKLAPEGYVPGSGSDRLVGFVDLGPTVLSLAGIEPPGWMQGHAFMGKHAAPEQPFSYGFRGRMDERYDMVRSVRDKRYVYVRNYMPHEPAGQHMAYMFQTPTTQVWKQLYDEGKLAPPKTCFWESKPAEELYDLENDPDEVVNLAASPDHHAILRRLRRAQRDLAIRIREVSFLPEPEIHTRSRGRAPYEMGHDPDAYPLEKIMAAAESASSLEPDALGDLIAMLDDPDRAVRYWGAMGILMRAPDSVPAALDAVRRAMHDDSPSVRIVAAEVLGKHGDEMDQEAAVKLLIRLSNLEENGIYVSMMALNGLDELDEQAKSSVEEIRNLPQQHASVHPRMKNNVPKLLDKILADLEDSEE